jgi:hypothetical protein
MCYCLIGVLQRLYKNVDSGHIEELEAITNLCDASILDDIPEEIEKLSGRIVKRWWTSHGLPYVTDVICVVPEVRILATRYDAFEVADTKFYFLS